MYTVDLQSMNLIDSLNVKDDCNYTLVFSNLNTENTLAILPTALILLRITSFLCAIVDAISKVNRDIYHYTVYTLYSVHLIQCTHYTVYTLYSVYIIQCINLYIVHCTHYQCTHYTVYTL